MAPTTPPTAAIAFGQDGKDAYAELTPEYFTTLTAPLDDMWATFADQADPLALLVYGKTVGCGRIDESGDIHRFYLQPSFEHVASAMLDELRAEREVTGFTASSADPFTLSTALTSDTDAHQVCRNVPADPRASGQYPGPFRRRNHGRVATFMCDTLGAPEEFINWYISGLIERSELFIFEQDGKIAGTGERRVDPRFSGHAHVGIIVGKDHRNAGLGTNLMSTLFGIASSGA